MNLKQHWREFKSDPPGSRFTRRYERHRRNHRGLLQSVLTIAGAMLAIVAGLIMLVLPGPGLLALLFAAGLIAEESLFAARWLDRAELWLRRRWGARRKP